MRSAQIQRKAEIRPLRPARPARPVWAYSGKIGIGSSYERYVDGEYWHNADTGAVSKVWFSLAEGIVTETMFGLIHQAQIKETIVLSNVFEWAASV